MGIIVLASGKGSPGVSCTALALALAWPLHVPGTTSGPERVLVVEADAAGTSAVPGYLQGTCSPAAGMATLVGTSRQEMGERLPQAVIRLEGQPDRYLLPGLSGPTQMAAHRHTFTDLAGWLRVMTRSDILVDLGRVGAAAEPSVLVQAADLVVVVCRSSMPSVLGALHAVSYLRSLPGSAADSRPSPIRFLLVGERSPYTLREVQAALEIQPLGVLAHDARSAAVFSDGHSPGRGFARGPLMRSASHIAQTLTAYLTSETATVRTSGTTARPGAKGKAVTGRG
ncbi:MAG: hypothetical protein QG597_4165 [Actinomycetota bacterium]|nr:hypothetical protein [Actinomycetota bacterium]